MNASNFEHPSCNFAGSLKRFNFSFPRIISLIYWHLHIPSLGAKHVSIGKNWIDKKKGGPNSDAVPCENILSSVWCKTDSFRLRWIKSNSCVYKLSPRLLFGVAGLARATDAIHWPWRELLIDLSRLLSKHRTSLDDLVPYFVRLFKRFLAPFAFHWAGAFFYIVLFLRVLCEPATV